MEQKSSTPMPFMPPGLGAFMGMTNPGLKVMTEMNGHLYEGLAAFNRDWVVFMNKASKGQSRDDGASCAVHVH